MSLHLLIHNYNNDSNLLPNLFNLSANNTITGQTLFETKGNLVCGVWYDDLINWITQHNGISLSTIYQAGTASNFYATANCDTPNGTGSYMLPTIHLWKCNNKNLDGTTLVSTLKHETSESSGYGATILFTGMNYKLSSDNTEDQYYLITFGFSANTRDVCDPPIFFYNGYAKSVSLIQANKIGERYDKPSQLSSITPQTDVKLNVDPPTAEETYLKVTKNGKEIGTLNLNKKGNQLDVGSVGFNDIVNMTKTTKPTVEPSQPVKPDKIIIDFLHTKDTQVQLMSVNDPLRPVAIATNPINYDFTGSKGVQISLETDLKPDSTKYITDDAIYNIYYFKNGKPNDLDTNNYSLDYLNTHADTKYITNTKSNNVLLGTNNDGKKYEYFRTPCSFNDYGYYLILPLELKDYYGVLVDDKDNVLQKVYPNRENKIEEQYRPKNKNTVIGYYDTPYDEVGIILTDYYFYHNKDYGITSKGFIDPNKYDNFICIPFDLMDSNSTIGELPAFKLKYKTLTNIKTDLGGYYNPTTGKIDPITTTGKIDPITTEGSTGTGQVGQIGGNTPIKSNDQIHLYSINQQNILDLSSKDLSYQTSLKGFATYDANNFINQVYILPFSLPTNLKENVSNIVTGLFKLDTDTVAVKQDHYNLDLGSITIKPKYNNGFDYNVTKCTLHLPFTNLINLDINDILNKTISIKYRVSLLNADTTVNILSDDNLIFTGKINIGTDLQLFSINSNNITGLLNSVLQNEVLTPYITITRNKPITNLVSYETKEHNQLNNYTGFIQTNNSNVSCGTQEEQIEIENLLNGGIYIK